MTYQSKIKRWTALLMAARRLTQAELGRRTGKASSEVFVSLHGRHEWRFKRLNAYAEALGVDHEVLRMPKESEEEAIQVLIEQGMPPVPRELCWDCRDRKPPKNLMWRLRRIARYFPAHGRDPATIAQLIAHKDSLGLSNGAKRVLEAFHETSRNSGLH